MSLTTTITAGRGPTSRSPRGGARRRASWRSSEEGARRSSPVTIEGRKIARTFWGKAWCDNLERYSDYANRLPRGRTYVRNGSVVDLQIAPGSVTALVSGSTLYDVEVTIAPGRRRRAGTPSASDCSGAIDSLVELLQGRFSKGVMTRICEETTGLFPSPKEIALHVQLPGLGDDVQARRGGALRRRRAAGPAAGASLHAARRRPEELIAGIGESFPLPAAPASAKVLADGDVAALFGIDMGETAGSGPRHRCRSRHEFHGREGSRRGAQRRHGGTAWRVSSPATLKKTRRRVGKAKRAHA